MIISIVEKDVYKTKSGKQTNVLTVVDSRFNKKRIFATDEQLEQAGFTEDMVSVDGKLTPLEVDITLEDFPSILAIEHTK